MKKMNFMKYEAPEVEIIEVEVEKGFAGSDENVDGEVTVPGMGGIS